MPVTPYSTTSGTIRLSSNQWSLALRMEIALLEAADAVVDGSIAVYQAGHLIVISCTVCRHQPAQVVDPRFQIQEPIAFVYLSDRIGLSAPVIFSERDDFPRNVPHLNPVDASSPVSICIARQGTQALYDRGGVGAVIHELANWLTDAAAGTLEHDGWEPYPLPGDDQVSLDSALLQSHALQQGGGKHPVKCYGMADTVFIYRDDKIVRMHFELDPRIQSLNDLKQCSLEKEEHHGEERFSITPWFFTCAPRTHISEFRVADLVRTKEDLMRLAQKAGCHESLQQFLNHTWPALQPKFGSSACLIMGLWRPKPLIAEIPGLADGDGRHLELFAFMLSNKNPGNASAIQVYPLRILAMSTPELRAAISGLPQPPDGSAIFGCGALGSKISAFLSREGIRHLSLADPETVAPHNPARHELGWQSVGLYKAKELKGRCEHLVGNDPQQGGIACRARVTSTQTISNLKDIVGPNARWLIDSTADKRAFQYFCSATQPYPVIRTELVDEGRLGVLMAEGSERAPRLSDLHAVLYSLSTQYDEIAVWLARDEALPAVMVGQGCTSDTLILPDYQIASHAASFMPAINARLCGDETAGGIGLNRLNEDGTPAGWHWVSVPPFVEMPLQPFNGEEEWTLRIHQAAHKFIQEEVKKHTQVEAGGYLYGRYDLHQKIITVTDVFYTPALEATRTKLKLPPAGGIDEEKRLLTRSQCRLMPMGSWHIHIDGTPEMSPTDEQQAAKFAEANKRTPHPVMMFIVSRQGEKGYLIYPNAWIPENEKNVA